MYLPMFSWHVFRANLLDLGLVSHEQLNAMKKECYTMRKEDPIGRRRSNNGAGWQSVDGVNDRPIFQSLLNGVYYCDTSDYRVIDNLTDKNLIFIFKTG